MMIINFQIRVEWASETLSVNNEKNACLSVCATVVAAKRLVDLYETAYLSFNAQISVKLLYLFLQRYDS